MSTVRGCDSNSGDPDRTQIAPSIRVALRMLSRPTTVCADEYMGVSQLSIVDGETMEQVALLQMPARVPFGIHAHWMGEEELSEHIAHTREKAARLGDKTSTEVLADDGQRVREGPGDGLKAR